MHQLRRLASRRIIAALAAMMLLLSEVGLLFHQIEHRLVPGHDHCALCLVASHFGSAAASSLPSVVATVCPARPQATVLPFQPAAFAAFFYARAPPRPSLSS